MLKCPSHIKHSLQNLENIFMKIEKTISEQYIEDLLKTDNVSFLEFPNKFTNIKFDLRARFFQVLTTLISQNHITKIIVKNMDIDTQDNLYKKLEFIGSLSRVIQLFSSTEPTNNQIKQYIVKLKEFLNNMDNFENLSLTMKGEGFQIINFDWREEFCYWKTVYYKDNDNKYKFIDEEKFINIFSQSIIKITNYSRKDVGLTSITKMLYELYKNTHDHAKSTLINQLSIRGFYANKVSIKTSEMDKYISYRQYFESLQIHRKTDYTDMHFIELSIFDSGPGFFQTLNSKSPVEVTHEEEKEGTLECFSKYMTSKGSSTYGRGLHSVLDNLKTQKGLLILRTGRMKIMINGLDLNDTFDISEAKCEFYEYIKGTSVTLILPQAIKERNLFS